MRKETFEGSFKSWFGKPLTKLKVTSTGELNTVAEIGFKGSYDAYGPDKDPKTYTDADWLEAYNEIDAAKELPTVKDIVEFRNNQRLNKARQASMNAQVTAAGLDKPTTANDYDLRLKKMSGLFEDQGVPAEMALAMAIEALKKADEAKAARDAEQAAKESAE